MCYPSFWLRLSWVKMNFHFLNRDLEILTFFKLCYYKSCPYNKLLKSLFLPTSDSSMKRFNDVSSLKDQISFADLFTYL